MTSDDRKYDRLRARLVEDLRVKGIEDERVLAAIGRVPRHRFVEPAMQQRAYEDEALPIGLNQTISQPYTVAHQTLLIEPKRRDRILEIGTGSGYQAAVLCEMGAEVYSIERHQALHDRAKAILRELGYRVITKCGDGTLGWPAFAPYDKIVVTAGAAGVPEALLEQLAQPKGDTSGGCLVIPVGSADEQMMKRIYRTGEHTYRHEETNVFRFVPLVGEGKLIRGNR
ncbi:MAG: protein-L-isoaspartate(D-aspartate) O-methyltransferase [Rhodothermales bacterium]|nr:protein-L-isoaspartate(D-aspartate) O-methyltransferase [Rhodothermales bacterium]